MDINSKKKLQDIIYLLNESSNKKKLKLNDSNNDQFNINTELYFFFNQLANTSFTTSKDVLHPNLISFLIKNNICKIKRELDGTKIICFLENKSKKRVYISKQIYFGYIFVEQLKRYRKKKHMKNFFDEDNYIENLKMEEWTRSWNGVKNTRRLDFLLDIGNDRKIIIEYLEDHHMEELKDWNVYQSIRMVDILFGEMKDNIVHFAFIWDKNCDSKYLKDKAKNISDIIKNFHDIDNEKQYTINVLNEQFKNKNFSKIMYESYFHENEPIVDLDLIFSEIFPIKKENIRKIKNKFLDISNKITKAAENNEEQNIFSDSESESDNELLNISEDKKKYYLKDNDKIVISNHGLALFLTLCNIEDFDNINDFAASINLINNISKSAYTSAVKIRELIVKQKDNIISGLDEI
tara:strand:- start:833 stop:2056 length:1224 start_codon:yes stop_codon:yes gene_type:complete